MAELTLLVPSRGRPGNAARLIEAMEATCTEDTHLVLGLDGDDPELENYLALDLPPFAERCISERRLRLVAFLNALADHPYHLDDPLIGHLGDDNVPETEGWDRMVIKSLQDHLFCFGDDRDPGRPPGSLSIHIFMRRSVVETLGYMGPPSITHMYVDPVWYAWGTRTSIEFLSEFSVPHLHYSLGHDVRDASYTESTDLIPRDCSAYNAYCDDMLNADILRLGGTPFTDVELAEFNAALNIPRSWT